MVLQQRRLVFNGATQRAHLPQDAAVKATRHCFPATRRDAGAARTVVLPYFTIAMQSGTQVVAKRIGNVALNFAAGSIRAQTSGQATIQVLRSAATLPEDIRKELTRERRPTDADAAVDPLSAPNVRAAVARATFEHLVGFQLTQEQLKYNATR